MIINYVEKQISESYILDIKKGIMTSQISGFSHTSLHNISRHFQQFSTIFILECAKTTQNVHFIQTIIKKEIKNYLFHSSIMNARFFLIHFKIHEHNNNIFFTIILTFFCIAYTLYIYITYLKHYLKRINYLLKKF